MQRRAIDTQERILAAGLALFARQGYHGTSVDAIAEKAAANKERIYAYFGSKEKLFLAALRRSYESLLEYEQALLELNEDNVASLTKIVLAHFMAFHEKHPTFWRMLAWSNLQSVPGLKAIRGVRSPTFNHLRTLYTHGQTQGLFQKTVSFETYIFALSALSFTYFANQRTMSQTLGRNLSKPTVRAKMLAELTNLVESGLKTSTSELRV